MSLLTALALTLSLTACATPKRFEEHATTIFAMDTVMNLTIYGDGVTEPGEDVLSLCVDAIYRYENTMSATKEDSEVSAINSAGGERLEVGASVAGLLARSVELCEKTGGALDITARPAMAAWGFTTGEYRVVDEAERAELVSRIDYSQLLVETETHTGDVRNFVTLPAGMELDLGAVAKGDSGDRLRTIVKATGVASALLDLGQSTIVAIGTKPNGYPFRIGIQDPAGTDYLGVLELVDQAMGSSGDYQRYFEQDGVRYGHIIDPDTAAPADSGLAGVTVVADSAMVCDGLSTALFVMGLEEAAQYWQENRDFEAIFIAQDGGITITAGLQDSFSLREGYDDREVTVLE